MARSLHIIPSALPLILGCIGCGGTGSDGPGHTVTDSAGVRIVTSVTSSWATDAAYVDTMPVLRIGSEEPGPYQFSFVQSGLLLPDGRIVVTEAATNEIRLFSPDGGHLGSMGGRGAGPGEFQHLYGPFPYHVDSLVAYDLILRRATIFPLAGGPPRVVGNPMPGNLAIFGVLEGGQLLLFNPGSRLPRDHPPGLHWDTTDIARFDLALASGRVLARFPSRQRFVVPGGDTRNLAPAHSAIQAADGEGFYWGTSDRYEIRYYDAEGALKQISRRPVEPRAVDPAMIEQWIQAVLVASRGFQDEAAAARSRRSMEEGPHGDRIPLFQQAFVDQDERLWVGEAVWPELQTPPRRWSLFAPDGAWLGDLMMPPGFKPLDSRGDLVLGVWRDADDLPQVQLRRLVRP